MPSQVVTLETFEDPKVEHPEEVVAKVLAVPVHPSHHDQSLAANIAPCPVWVRAAKVREVVLALLLNHGAQNRYASACCGARARPGSTWS